MITGACFSRNVGFSINSALTFKRNVLDGELIAAIRIESDGGRDQVLVLLHVVGIARFLCWSAASRHCPVVSFV